MILIINFFEEIMSHEQVIMFSFMKMHLLPKYLLFSFIIVIITIKINYQIKILQN